LATLDAVKRELGVPVLTDIHESEQAAVVAEVVDILQIPAFLARQTDLLQAVGKTQCTVNVKKGQFMSPQEMGNAIEKIRGAGGQDVLLTERGTFFGYNRLVNDFTGVPIMKQFGVPVVFDITHSTQQPAGLGSSSGGNPQFSPMLARCAVAAGADGLFMECHPDPRNAKSDAATMLGLDDVEGILRSAQQIFELRRGWKKTHPVRNRVQVEPQISHIAQISDQNICAICEICGSIKVFGVEAFGLLL
jgi:2-dehydro-3-deoxyphosphooctonate aldolase (KDO 8-P synthase)